MSETMNAILEKVRKGGCLSRDEFIGLQSTLETAATIILRMKENLEKVDAGENK